MKTRSKKQITKRPAFTIVELLTVMAVIAMLIGLLVPALNLVRRHAKDTQQHAQFNAISAGLELYRSDNGEYPRSEQLHEAAGVSTPSYLDSDTSITTGAQHLAEALLGRDFQGYDPQSTLDPSHDSIQPTILAYPQVVVADASASLDRRKGPYLDLEKVGAFNIDKLYPSFALSGIYGTTPAVAPVAPAEITGAPFITDVYADKQVTVVFSATVSRTVKAGTPVLYYRANIANRDLRKRTAANITYADRTYNYWDNANLLKLGRMMGDTGTLPTEGTPADVGRWHPLANNTAATTGINHQKFYDTITNPQIPNIEGVAVRSDTYILISAGRDGLFGTSDDVYNFGQ